MTNPSKKDEPLVESSWVANDADNLVDYYRNSNIGTGSNSIRDSIGHLEKKELKPSIEYKDTKGTMDSIMLHEANQWMNKSIYTFLAYKNLQMGDYLSWAKATLYYSRYFLNNALCRLQGCAITHGKYWFTFQVSRSNWSKRQYSFHRLLGGNRGRSTHKLTWDLAMDCYSKFNPKGLSSIDQKGISTVFSREYLRKFGITNIHRDELDRREDCTYDPYGFDELHYAEGFMENEARFEGNKNYIDSVVFQQEVDNQQFDGGTFDGRGVTEACHGALLEFLFELAGRISKVPGCGHVFYLKWGYLSNLSSNENTKKIIHSWTTKYNLPLR